jgi:hypothetical protein
MDVAAVQVSDLEKSGSPEVERIEIYHDDVLLDVPREAVKGRRGM